GVSRIYFAIRHGVIPISFVVVLVMCIFAVGNRFAFSVISEMGLVCNTTGDGVNTLQGGKGNFEFDISKGCVDSKINVKDGFAYKIDVNGLSSFVHGWWQPVAVPIRRNFIADWFVPIVRIGVAKGEEFVIENGRKTIVPRNGGRLFVFLNDGVLGWPSAWD